MNHLEAAAKLELIAYELRVLLQKDREAWSVTPDLAGTDKVWVQMRSPTGNGIALKARVKMWRANTCDFERAEIVGHYRTDHHHRSILEYGDKPPGAMISLSRDAEVVAADLYRRFVPAYRAFVSAIETRIISRLKIEDLMKQAIEPFASLPYWKIREIPDYGMPVDLSLVDFIDPGNPLAGATIRLTSPDRVVFTRLDVSRDLGLKIARLLSESAIGEPKL